LHVVVIGNLRSISWMLLSHCLWWFDWCDWPH